MQGEGLGVAKKSNLSKKMRKGNTDEYGCAASAGGHGIMDDLIPNPVTPVARVSNQCKTCTKNAPNFIDLTGIPDEPRSLSRSKR